MSEPEPWEEIIHQEESEELEWMKSKEAFKGKIPPIAEKEKLGKKVKIPPSEIYVREISSYESPNINEFVKSMDLPKSKSHVVVNLPSAN